MGAILAQEQRVGDAGFRETAGAEYATIAGLARRSVGQRVVATVRQPIVQPQLQAAADDLGLGEIDQRRMDAERAAFHSGPRTKRGDLLERPDELGPAIGIAGIVERVDADHEITCAEDLGPGERQRQKNGVPRGHVRHRDARRGQVAAVRHIGARRLQTVMERVLDEISFDATDKSGETIAIDAAYVRARIGDLAKNADLSKFIL